MGEIQPKVINKCLDDFDSDSGFLPRFLMVRAILKKPKTFNFIRISDSQQQYIDTVISRLMDLNPYKTDTEFIPINIGIDQDAITAYADFYNILGKEQFYKSIEGSSGALEGKLQNTIYRLALLIHAIDYACENGSLGIINKDQMKRAIKLVKWFKIHTEYCTQGIEEKEKISKNEKVNNPVYEPLIAVLENLNKTDSAVVRLDEIVTSLKKHSKLELSTRALGRFFKKYEIQTFRDRDQQGKRVTEVNIALALTKLQV